MKIKRKIAVVTGSRAEYGLLYWLLKEIQEDAELELQLIVTGMHLSPEFGSTYKLIEADGFAICAKVTMLLSNDSSVGIAKSIGLGVIGMADALEKLSPDLLVVLGDRFEILAAAQAALAFRIPIAHIHGGEITEGAIDDAIRHAITKMSHLHFVSTKPYKNRVIQMGEDPKRVFNVGSLGLERIGRMKLLNKKAWEIKLNTELGVTNFLVTYHPVTLKINETEDELKSLLTALDNFPHAKIIFTKSNADESGRNINLKIDEYVANNYDRAVSFITLGDLNYISLLQFVDVVIGNSSSGLIEPAIFKKPTVNIGDRQTNRLRSSSVIDCVGTTQQITYAIQKAMSFEYKKLLQKIDSPYEQTCTSSKIKNILKDIQLNNLIIKRFYDLSNNIHVSETTI